MSGTFHDDSDEIGQVVADMWRHKGLPDRMDLARIMIEAAKPWAEQSSTPGLIRDLVWELSSVAYRFTETPLLLFPPK